MSFCLGFIISFKPNFKQLHISWKLIEWHNPATVPVKLVEGVETGNKQFVGARATFLQSGVAASCSWYLSLNAHLSVLMIFQLLLPVWPWNWLVSAYGSATPSLIQMTSGGSSSSPPLPFRAQCILTGFPREEITVVGLRSNSKSLIKKGKKQD